MQGILYEEPSFWLFFLVTCLLGGWAAWMTGRAIALTWRPVLQLFFYLLVLGWAVRMIHTTLFDGTFLSLHFYVVDTIILLVIGITGWRYTRARQMTRQYRWLYELSGPLSWRRRTVGNS